MRWRRWNVSILDPGNVVAGGLLVRSQAQSGGQGARVVQLEGAVVGPVVRQVEAVLVRRPVHRRWIGYDGTPSVRELGHGPGGADRVERSPDALDGEAEKEGGEVSGIEVLDGLVR